jgi:hypothetical protein
MKLPLLLFKRQKLMNDTRRSHAVRFTCLFILQFAAAAAVFDAEVLAHADVGWGRMGYVHWMGVGVDGTLRWVWVGNRGTIV